MAASDWRLEGEWMKNCTCAFGCPCDFNARPTQGYCKGMVAMRIARGHFEGTRLDGLCFAITVDFPGPLHEGNGTIQPIIDERATAEQRQALFDIFSGKHSAEGTLFQIVSMIVTRIHDPVFAPFEFSFDKEGRVAKLVARGVLETDVEPIKNPVTGDPHRIQVVMPEGFEHRAAEVASANIRSTGAIPFETRGTHSSLANVVQTPEGVAA
ncbi:MULTISPECIES: DUF1326 domain-containing protein [Bradyrhizobium]|jgi:hypothetical protein|uniref:DUF1326 domain-containing protein n=1 Tax=Bradyrhizobium ottawaense TaxID=931866 RepID=A0A2U8P331_9BRAD|nr:MULTISPECIES: DUF1326 domain-containing protein [Bradyrhizobium]AWL92087.1 DUF1326 domain-containing protein [Bradyrhizobium ottawaense]MBR1325755.1 DUF1326 domain-containing protein [Bradyrhizobium ottawaense]MBR1331626.1 DUF1326 domain-containing protein [Bradyrhizobium ottawaense]MBR1361417.1 DUF1326 domain-containing protein [Bradyrhizobium ottawaense]MDA9416418.1 hypothetical protein [Bradyrhizobium sp. CCBAU 25360]